MINFCIFLPDRMILEELILSIPLPWRAAFQHTLNWAITGCSVFCEIHLSKRPILKKGNFLNTFLIFFIIYWLKLLIIWLSIINGKINTEALDMVTQQKEVDSLSTSPKIYLPIGCVTLCHTQLPGNISNFTQSLADI